MHRLPIIRDSESDFSGDCCPKFGATKELSGFHRTLPVPSKNSFSEEVLQDEAGFPILDDQTGGFIFDDLKG